MVQFSYDLLLSIFPDAALITRIICFVIGFVGLCLGSSLYMTADLGVSTYDAVALIMANKWKVGKFKFIRIATDLICIIAGIALFLFGGGALENVPAFVGAGTVLTAFFMGPLIDTFNRKIAEPILSK